MSDSTGQSGAGNPRSAGPDSGGRGRMGVGLIGAGLLGSLLGLLIGGAGYTAHYAKATSYLSDDPAACINCHIMNEQYDSWSKGAHHAHATCNDCHVPHDNVFNKYRVKAEHGYRHSKGFTFRDFHEPIRIRAADLAIVNQNCVRCHEAITSDIRDGDGGGVGTGGDRTALAVELAMAHSGGLDCTRCHAGVAHSGRR